MTNILPYANIKLTDDVLSAAEGLTHLFGKPYAIYEMTPARRDKRFYHIGSAQGRLADAVLKEQRKLLILKKETVFPFYTDCIIIVRHWRKDGKDISENHTCMKNAVHSFLCVFLE